jgi:hypothetical protein
MTVNHVGSSGGSQAPDAQSAEAQNEMQSIFKNALDTARGTALGVTNEQRDMAQPATAEFVPISYSPYHPYDSNPYDSNPYDSNPYDSNPYDSNPYDGNPYGEQFDVTGDPHASGTDLESKLAKLVADHPVLGDPCTYGPSERAKALVDCAVQAFPDPDVRLFDEVVSDPEMPTSPEEVKPIAEFSVDKTGKRMITIRLGMFEQPLTRQLMIAIHELVHADQWRVALSANEGDFSAVREQFFGISVSPAYAMREIETESRMLSLADSFLGSTLPLEDVERSQRSIESWQNFLTRARGGEEPPAPVAFADAFVTGSRSERAGALVERALQGLHYPGVSLSDFVDKVVYDPAAQAPAFWCDLETNERVITIDAGTFEKTVAGQLIAATHELIHADDWRMELAMNGGNVVRTNMRFFIAHNHPQYLIKEIQAERRALRLVDRLLGGLTPQQVAASTRYIEIYQQRLVRLGGQRMPDPPDWPWKSARP